MVMYGIIYIIITLFTGLGLWIVCGPIIDVFETLLLNMHAAGQIPDSLLTKITISIDLFGWMPVIFIVIAIVYGIVRALRKEGRGGFV